MIDILDKRVLDSHDYDDIKSVLYRGVLDKDVLNNPFRKKPKKKRYNRDTLLQHERG